MRILITGGTGYIGQALCPKLITAGHELVVFSRNVAKVEKLFGNSAVGIQNLSAVNQYLFDAVINLAGESIAGGRWTPARKRKLRDSRIALTQSLCDTLAMSPAPPPIFISGSAVGFYGNGGDTLLDETALPTPDFAQELCADWEMSAGAASTWGARVVKLRIGLVMGPGGGFLSPLKLPFKLGLGTRLGNGQQWMSWVSLNDMVSIIEYALQNDLHGPFNACSPHPVTNLEFTHSFASVLNRPVFPIPAPGFALKMALGELSQLVLGGQRAIPTRLLEAGYKFEHPELESALQLATK